MKKRPWIVAGLVLVAALAAVIGLRSRRPVAPVASEASGPWFAVRVEKPASAQPLGGLFGLVRLFSGDLGFSQASRGAAVGRVGPDRLELRADGWELSLVADNAGRIAPETRLVFPIELGGRDVSLRCRPADPPAGELESTSPAGSATRSGRFRVKLARCENAVSGKPLEWPPSPLTLVGQFDRLPRNVE